jgi:hypothetical protein
LTEAAVPEADLEDVRSTHVGIRNVAVEVRIEGEEPIVELPQRRGRAVDDA